VETPERTAEERPLRTPCVDNTQINRAKIRVKLCISSWKYRRSQ